MLRPRDASFLARVYTLYSAFALSVVVTTNIAIFEILPAVILLWTMFGAFRLGLGKLAKTALGVEFRAPHLDVSPALYYVMAVVSLTATVISTRFFVGVGPAEVFQNYRHGVSLYADYQQYNAILAPNLDAARMLPFLALRVIAQGLWLYALVAVALFDPSPRAKSPAVALMGLAALYPALARGTTFEAFKLAFLLLFILMLRSRSVRRFGQRITASLAVGVSCMVLFWFNVSSRGSTVGRCLTSDVCFTDGAAGPIDSMFGYLYGYFGHGFHFIGTMMNQVWLVTIGESLRGLSPLGMFELRQPDYLDRTALLVDMGPRWIPDAAISINAFGLVGLIAACWFLGVLARHARNVGSVPAVIARYLILLQMASFPVGNFVSVSFELQVIAAILLLMLWNAERLRPAPPGPADDLTGIAR